MANLDLLRILSVDNTVMVPSPEGMITKYLVTRLEVEDKQFKYVNATITEAEYNLWQFFMRMKNTIPDKDLDQLQTLIEQYKNES